MPRLARDAEPRNELLEFLHYQLDEQAYLKAEQLLKAITDTSSTAADNLRPDGSPQPGGAMDTKYAMDSGDAFTRMNDLRNAEREVAPVVGEILGMDSAAAVFREALVRMGVDARTLHASGLPTMFRTVRRNGAAGGRPATAHSARASADFARRFPEIDRIRVLG